MQIIKLSNGLTLVSYPIECAQSIEMGMYIKAGSRYETKENNGITHMLEHMHFRQLGEILQEDIYRETECMGTSPRGATYKEMLCFNMKIRPQFLEKSLSYFEKILTTYNWTESQLESEKKIVLAEMREKTEQSLFQTIADKTIWKNNSLSKQILGNEETIESLTLEKLVNYKKEIFSKDNIAFVITGAINDVAIKTVCAKLETVILNDNKTPADKIVPEYFERKPKIVLQNYPSWELLDIQLSFNVELGLIRENELLFLNSILGGGDGSVLQQELREKMGFVYEIYSEVEIYKDVAVLSIIFSITRENVYKALEKIMDILKKLKQNISQINMDMNRIFFTENLWFWLEDSYQLNFQLGNDFVEDKELLTIEERIKANEKVSSTRLQEVAEFAFTPERMSLIVMGPTRKVKQKVLEDKLKLSKIGRYYD